MLCATVNAVTVFSSIHRSFTISSNPSRNSRWSAPKEKCDGRDGLQHDWQSHPRTYGRAPQNVIVIWRGLLDFQICRASLVRHYAGRKTYARENPEQKKNSHALPDSAHGPSGGAEFGGELGASGVLDLASDCARGCGATTSPVKRRAVAPYRSVAKLAESQ